MKITYIDHSGFSMEDANHVFLFDYYKGTIPEFDSSKKIYVFSSHAHPDHFQKKIFTLSDKYSDVTYILSDDIRVHKKETEKLNIVKVSDGKSYNIDDLSIQTLASTDEGVAFVIEWEGKRLYHAGDLNWWHWNGETKTYNDAMADGYKQQIEKIKGQSFDISFVPLDGRLEDKYSLGLDYFASNTDSSYIFPMHLWGQYSLCGEFKREFADRPYISRIMTIDNPGQTWEI